VSCSSVTACTAIGGSSATGMLAERYALG
jgi:hypothetical protein